MGRNFELDDDTVLVVHEDGRVRQSPLPVGVDPHVFRNALAAVDVLYRREGVFPNVKEVHELWPEISQKTYSKIFAMSEFKQALELRGIAMQPSLGLTDEQNMAILLLSDPTDRRQTNTKLRQLGISMPKYQAWMRQPLFSQTLRQRAEQNLGDAIPVALNRLVGNAEAGDQRAVEKLLEVTGRYNPQQIELQNARMVILRIVEIVLSRVTDQAVRNEILQDLTSTMSDVTDPGTIALLESPKED